MSWWTCIAGAGKYLTGGRRPEPAQVDAAGWCATCPRLRTFREDGLHGTCGRLVRWFLPRQAPLTGWCGNPGESTEKTCGCLVLAQAGTGEPPQVTVKIKGEEVGMRAAGKTTVAAEKCPAGLW